MEDPASAYIGLGSNVGEREKILRGAVRALDAREGIEVSAVSSFYETEPVGGPPQGRYLNAAVEVRTSLEPRPLLRVLQSVEDCFGRTREVRWGPRTLDLDLLLFGGRVVEEPDLRVPHPLMHRRAFVLRPLCEIAPGARHPILGRTVEELLEELDEDGRPSPSGR